MASTMQQVKVVHTRQSHHLSPKVWYILAKSLGIKFHPQDRPIFGTVLYILTLLFAAAFSVSHTWYIIYDIINIYTRQTVLTGLVTIAMVLYWCALGVYANQLASKLFNSPKFVDSMRMHTRTVFKVSAAGILVVVGATMTLLTSITASQMFSSDYCHNVSVSVVVCKVMFVSRVGYSVFSLVWNLLVGIVLLSVCRTHTIGESSNQFTKIMHSYSHLTTIMIMTYLHFCINWFMEFLYLTFHSIIVMYLLVRITSAALF